jgi:hypothetical protein
MTHERRMPRVIGDGMPMMASATASSAATMNSNRS